MIVKKNIFLAVAFAAAFFLEAKIPSVTYQTGRVDVVDLTDEKTFEPQLIESNQSLHPKLLVATAMGGRIESLVDQKHWRLGSNSMARWYSHKKFWLHSGSALYCSTQKDTIHFATRESNATFVGHGTIIIEATKNGGFKFIPLEGKGTITTAQGGTKEIVGGRMLLVLGKPTYFGDAYDLDLMLLIRSSRLINAFTSSLPTFKKIGLAIYVQELKLKGKYDALIGDATTNENLQMWKFGKSNEPVEKTN